MQGVLLKIFDLILVGNWDVPNPCFNLSKLNYIEEKWSIRFRQTAFPLATLHFTFHFQFAILKSGNLCNESSSDCKVLAVFAKANTPPTYLHLHFKCHCSRTQNFSSSKHSSMKIQLNLRQKWILLSHQRVRLYFSKVKTAPRPSSRFLSTRKRESIGNRHRHPRIDI